MFFFLEFGVWVWILLSESDLGKVGFWNGIWNLVLILLRGLALSASCQCLELIVLIRCFLV